MAQDTSSETGVAGKTGGFPPFDTSTFPSQLVWLAITFSILFVVLWRIAGPKIGGAIRARHDKIRADLERAEKHKRDAEAARAGYEAALAEARKRAHALADENRKRVHDEIDAAKANAESEAQKVTEEAERRIGATRESALAQVAKTAEEAAIAIVAHLTGETVPPEDARAAVAARAH